MTTPEKIPFSNLLKSLWRSIWLFPLLLAVPLVLFTILGINGSSIGTYTNIFYGDSTKDPHLILGQPRSIRSDEWLVNSQMTLAQDSNNYARVNDNIGNGQDMSIAIDAPYKDWSMIFRPHNLAFFVLPFDNAFAFRWWFIGYLLIISCYLFIVTLTPKKRLWAALLSLMIFFNPFIQWWYLTGTMAPLYFSLFSMAAFMQFMKMRKRAHAVLWGLVIAYLITCFALVLYPPFQIPCAIVATSFGLGYLYSKYKKAPRQEIMEKLVILVVSVLIASLATFAFVYTRREAIKTIRSTAYPGNRLITSGLDNALNKTFSAPLSFGLQSEKKGANYFTNYYTSQSESANFIKINLIFVPVILLLIYRRRELRKTSSYNVFIATSMALAILCIRIFTPFFDLPFKALLLGQVQHERLEIGLLLLCIVQLALLGDLLLKSKGELISRRVALITALTAVALFGDSSLSMAKKYPQFIQQTYLIVLVVVAVGISLYLLLRKKTFAWGLALFLFINVMSSIGVNPLYVGAKPKPLVEVTKHINAKYNDGKTWAVFDSLIIENIPQMADKHSLTGVYSYPQLKLWGAIDEGFIESYEYNRYAHSAFTVTKASDGGQFAIPSPDILLISFECDMAKKLPNFGYAISPIPFKDDTMKCFTQSDKLQYPNLTLYIYKYSP